MKQGSMVASLAGTVVGAVAFICVFVLEIAAFGAVLSPAGENVGWDPVSLWNQSPLYGKLLLMLIAAVVIAIPVIAFVWSFRLVYRRLAGARIQGASS